MISNSLKFTPIFGEITIEINIEKAENITDQIDSNQQFINLGISVLDNGKGISEEGIKKLFVNFNKLDENKE